MLFFTGIELIFFIAEYGAVFSVCAGDLPEQGIRRVKTFSAPHSTSPERRLGVHKELGEEEGRGDIWSDGAFLSQINTVHHGALLSCRCLNTCLSMQSGEWILSFALVVRAFFFNFLDQTDPISTHEFSHIYSSDYLCHTTGRKWSSACVGCQLELSHD